MISAYIAHTSECTGWDLDDILKDTMFKKSARTWRFPKIEKVHMLDWDFRRIEQRGFLETWVRHLDLTVKNNLDVVMSPDYFPNDDWTNIFDYYEILRKHNERVVMPIHTTIPDGYDIEIAWPMGVWTQDYAPIWEVQDAVTHLLGGSPHAQLRFSHYFPNLKSIDGNQAFWCASRFGKYWRKRWIKPEPPMTNEECFRESVRNITNAWEEQKIADLVLEIDDKVTRQKSDTTTLVFIGKHDTEAGDFKLTYKVEGDIPSFWKAVLGEGETRKIYVTISTKSKQTKLVD